mgnify:CR=1 FL=1
MLRSDRMASEAARGWRQEAAGRAGAALREPAQAVQAGGGLAAARVGAALAAAERRRAGALAAGAPDRREPLRRHRRLCDARRDARHCRSHSRRFYLPAECQADRLAPPHMV